MNDKESLDNDCLENDNDRLNTSGRKLSADIAINNNINDDDGGGNHCSKKEEVGDMTTSSSSLTESKCRLEDMFHNESNNVVEKEDDDNKEGVRQTASTKGMWGENDDDDDNDASESENNDDDEGSTVTALFNNRCCYYLLRIGHRICHPHIHPPCMCLRQERRSSRHVPTLCFPCLQNNNRLSPRHQRIICRSIIIIFMIVTITFTLLDLLILHKYLHVWLDDTLAWMHHNPVSGGLSFIGVFLLGSLCFFPVALLSLGAGYVYIELYGLGLGIFIAFIICYLGCVLGAAVCFARSRYLMRQLIERFSVRYPIVRAVDKAFETMGFRLFLLLRLSPAMPFNALNYIGGITAISFRNYLWATVVGVAPGLLWTIFVGATFGTVNAKGVDGNKEFDSDGLRKGLVLGLGIGLGVCGLVGTAIYARRELIKIVIAEQRERALEELNEQLMNDDAELTAIEEGDDGWDLENPQLGECESSLHESEGIDSSIYSINSRVETSSQQSTSTPQRRQKTKQRSWTPEAVANELPILPKVIQRYIPMIKPTIDDIEDVEMSSAIVADGSNRKRSISPISDTGFQLDLIESKNAQVAEPKRNRASSADNWQLAHIDEMNEVSESASRAHLANALWTPVRKKSSIGNRYRSNTDPTDRGDFATATAKDSKSPTPSRCNQDRRRQWTEADKESNFRLPKRHSFGSLRQLPQKADQLSSNRRVSLETMTRSHSAHSLTGHNRPRSNSLPFERCDGNLVFDNGGNLSDDAEGEPSREWFWIWA